MFQRHTTKKYCQNQYITAVTCGEEQAKQYLTSCGNSVVGLNVARDANVLTSLVALLSITPADTYSSELSLMALRVMCKHFSDESLGFENLINPEAATSAIQLPLGQAVMHLSFMTDKKKMVDIIRFLVSNGACADTLDTLGRSLGPTRIPENWRSECKLDTLAIEDQEQHADSWCNIL